MSNPIDPVREAGKLPDILNDYTLHPLTKVCSMEDIAEKIQGSLKNLGYADCQKLQAKIKEVETELDNRKKISSLTDQKITDFFKKFTEIKTTVDEAINTRNKHLTNLTKECKKLTSDHETDCIENFIKQSAEVLAEFGLYEPRPFLAFLDTLKKYLKELKSSNLNNSTKELVNQLMQQTLRSQADELKEFWISFRQNKNRNFEDPETKSKLEETKKFLAEIIPIYSIVVQKKQLKKENPNTSKLVSSVRELSSAVNAAYCFSEAKNKLLDQQIILLLNKIQKDHPFSNLDTYNRVFPFLEDSDFKKFVDNPSFYDALDLEGAELEKIQRLNKNAAVTSLYDDVNAITHPLLVTHLNLSSYPHDISRIDFSRFPNLKKLDLSETTGLTSNQLSSLEKLEELSFPYNFDVSSINFSRFPNLKKLDLSETTGLTSNQLSSLEKLEDLSFPRTFILPYFDVSSINFSRFPNLKRLDLSDTQGLTSNQLSSLEKLEELLFPRGFDVSSFNFSRFPNLKKLNLLGINGFTSEQLSSLKKLEELYLPPFFRISDIDISCVPNLKKLNLSHLYSRDERFTSEQLSSFKNLEEIIFPPHLNVSRFDFSSVPNLKKLDLHYGRGFTSEQLNSLKKLEELSFSYNFDILNFDFSRFPNLKKLDLLGAKGFTSEHLSSLENLEELLLPRTVVPPHFDVSDFDFSRVPNLKKLNLSSATGFTQNHCKQLKNLEELGIEEISDISNIDFNALVKLKKVRLFQTPSQNIINKMKARGIEISSY